LFTDIRLGGALNGWDVAEIFRDRFPNVRVVYASGHFTDQRRDVAESQFFAKPYRLDDILEACERWRLQKVRRDSGYLVFAELDILWWRKPNANASQLMQLLAMRAAEDFVVKAFKGPQIHLDAHCNLDIGYGTYKK
jgi:hypothetical protein